MSEFSTETGATVAAATDRLQYQVGEQTGTAVMLLDSSGNPRENNRVFPFGEPWLAFAASNNSEKFTTYQRDSEPGEVGLDYAMARHYLSASGRFMTPDPGHVGADPADPQGWNVYVYSFNDAINFTDPTGLCPPEDESFADCPVSPTPIVVNVKPRIGSGGGGTGVNFGWWPSFDEWTKRLINWRQHPTQSQPSSSQYHPIIGPAPIKKSEPSAPGSFEAFVGLDGDLVGIFGVEGAFGLVLNFKKFTESGVYGGIGPAAGANVGISVNGGLARRGVSGWSTNIDGNFAKVSPTVSFDNDGLNGGALGIGPGIGLSISALKTGKYTLSDFGTDMSRAWNWFFAAR